MMPKQLQLGGLAEGRRPALKRKVWHKDCINNRLRKANITQKYLENLAQFHSSWREIVHTGKKDFEQNRVQHEKPKRDIRNGTDDNFLENVVREFELTSNVCGRV